VTHRTFKAGCRPVWWWGWESGKEGISLVDAWCGMELINVLISWLPLSPLEI